MRNRVRASGASTRRHDSAKIPTSRERSPRASRAWHRDLRSGTAFAALFALGLVGCAPAALAGDAALPAGGAVTHGNATISGSGNALLIEQTSGSAIISWDTFSVGAGAITHFSNGAGATLNRVAGNVPSTIDGSLTATGSLFLVNPAGVTVGTGGMVATGGSFVASTHDVSDEAFLNGGDTVFAGDSKAEIVNHGIISSAMGDVALIARRVENTGDISAPNGTAALLAGYDVLMHETTGPNGKFAVRVGGSDTEAVNSGTINAAEVELRANGGNVLALAGNTKGVIKATGVARSGGRIFLTAGGGKVQTSGRVSARRRVSSDSSQQAGGDVFINADTVLASGQIDVSGLGTAGGNIDIGGREIALQGASLDASGTTGGGRIRVGGEYQGGDFGALTTSHLTTVDQDTMLTANAIESGDGGEVVVWANGTTLFDGIIEAKGGALGGDGGLAETSGKERLWVGQNAYVNALAPNGATGDWLLDPKTITVATGGAATLAQAADESDTASDITIAPGTINAAAANVKLFATDMITVTDAIDNNNGIMLSFISDQFVINAAVDVGSNGTLLFDRVTAGAFGLGFNAGVATLNVTELGRLTARSLIIGDPTAAQNKISQLDLQGTFDLSGNITGLVRLSALSSDLSFVTSKGSHTFHAVQFNANDGVTYTDDETVTTTVGDMTYNVDANSGGSGGFNDLRAQSGDVVITSAANLSVTTQKLSETSGGTLSLNAAGNIAIARSTSGTIGVGDGASGGLAITDAQLGRMSAASLTIGDTSNTTTINVDGINIASLGAMTLNTTNGGTIDLTDSVENYTFASLDVNGGTANLGATINTAGAQTYDAAINLTADTTATSSADGDIAFNSTIDGFFDLAVNTGGATLFDGDIGTSTRLGDITTDAGGTTTLQSLTLRTSGTMTFNDAVTGVGGLSIDSNQGGGNTTFASTVDGGDWIIAEPSTLTFGGAVGGTTALTGLQLTSQGTVNINGGLVRTTDLMRLRGHLVFDSTTNTTTLESTGGAEIRLGESASNTVRSATDGEESLIIETTGDTQLRGVVGDNNQRLNSITTDTGGTTTISSGHVATTGSQTYNDQVSVTGTVLASTGGSLSFGAGITTTLPNSDLWLLAADDINVGGDIQWAGTGDVTLVAGWNAATDGSTGWTLGDTDADNILLATAGNYGLGTGDIFAGDGTQTTGVSVGSRDGTTTALARNLVLDGGALNGRHAQLGFAGAATGDIVADMTGGVSVLAGGAAAHAHLGHGGSNVVGDLSGDITISAVGDIVVTSGGNGDSYAQIGHGGYSSDGSYSGTITIQAARDLLLTAPITFVQLGHGGSASTSSSSGDISVVAARNVELAGGTGGTAFARIGHTGIGLAGADGDMTIAASGRVDLTGGGLSGDMAQIGHAHTFSADGAITLAVDGDLDLTGGADGDAIIGHSQGNTRMGDISAIVGGVTSLDANGANYRIGHGVGGTVSNADVALVTNGLSFAGLSPATGPGAGSGDFATMIQNNLRGGNVLIANRLAQIADADSGNPDYLDDIIYFGRDSSDEEVDTDHSLFVAATGEVSFEHGLQMNGSGNINLVAGWDGTTGLDLTGFPVLSMTDIETAGAFGSSTGSEGDNGDINIREFNPVLDIAVGTWMGDIHALAHDLEVSGGPTDFSGSRLGARPQASTDVNGDIRVVVKDDVLVLGGDGEFSSAAIGHAYGDGFGDITGNITILGENDANDNEIVVAGGDALFSVARIGHDSFEGEAHGDVLIRGEDIFVEGGSENVAFAQIGHFAELANGNFDIGATGALEVLGGADDDTYAQIGHNAENASGDFFVSVGGDLAVVGGDDEFADAQIGNIGDFASGNIEIDVAGLAILLGGFDFVADAQIGHDSGTLSSGVIDLDIGGPLIIAALDEDALAYVGHSGITDATGNINVDVGDSLIMGTLGDLTAAQIGHLADGANSGKIAVGAGGTIFLGNLTDGSYTKVGHGNLISNGALSGDIDITAGGPIALYGGLFGTSFAQFGHGDPFGSSSGTRQGDITVIADGEITLDDGLAAGSLAWIGHGTGTAGGVSNADVFLQAFGFDRELLGTVPAGDLGRFNKDILEADILGGDFTLVATGTGLLVEDPIYNSPHTVTMAVNNDLVLDTNAIFVNSGIGDIILAAGGDFHNDTGSLTPFTTGGRWLVYSTRPDNNRNDIEITNWDFLRYSTVFDINNPLVGSGDGLIYSVTPVVNFSVSDETINYGQPLTPTITQFLTVNGLTVDALAFGLGINPATAQAGLASFVTTDTGGNALAGSYPDGLVTANEMMPYFGMTFVTNPGDLTVVDTTTTVDPATNPTTIASMGIGEMCAFRSDDEDPDEDGESYDRIIELCGIIESDRD